tara:strand:- start:140 stop:514 length:375 start_codon:yes stop_codon:yes gene_type:complete
MELKNFIKNVIVEICEGVCSAQEELKDTNAMINPSLINDKNQVDNKHGNRSVKDIAFNIGLSIENKEGSKGGLGIVTGLFSAGASAKTEENNKSITSVKFSVPLCMPTHDTLKKNKAAFMSTTM